MRAAAILNTAELGDAFKRHARAAEGALNQAGDGSDARATLLHLAAQPQIVLGVVLLFASLFLTFMTIGPPGVGGGIQSNLISFPGKVEIVKAQILASQQMMSAGESLMGVRPGGESSKFGAALFFMSFAPLVYLAPAGAVTLLVAQWRRRRYRLLELSLGVFSLALLAMTLVIRASMANAVQATVGAGGDAVSAMIQPGLGAWLIALCGAGLIAVAFGILRRTPGVPTASIA